MCAKYQHAKIHKQQKPSPRSQKIKENNDAWYQLERNPFETAKNNAINAGFDYFLCAFHLNLADLGIEIFRGGI